MDTYLIIKAVFVDYLNQGDPRTNIFSTLYLSLIIGKCTKYFLVSLSLKYVTLLLYLLGS